ncbi:YpuI family protein [Anoxybacteroides tepidamans]|uniref:YpuI family protein n=1 Tax=Anoxybacteroides tepidamans TaxID=265948 RepID=UPI000489F191|nr:YpuI family protein [Anoxybacillus tepidamans]
MGNSIVMNQTKQVEAFLQKTVQAIAGYLNETTIMGLLAEQDDVDQTYAEQLLSNLRRLVVYCEEGLEACRIVLGDEPFRKAAAEKALYRVYHSCIAEFFAPKNDAWYEDSRSAYTGRNSIKFRQTPPPSLQALIASVEGSFQAMREELEFYETDYRTKMMQSK